MPHITVHLFSPFRVHIAGSDIPKSSWHGQIPRVLLKILALEPAGRTADELIDYVWPDLDPDQGRKRLYEAMSRLRSTLSRAIPQTSAPGGRLTRAHPIHMHGTGYRLSQHVRVDLHLANEQISRFRSLCGTDRSKALEFALRLPVIEPANLLREQLYADWAITARERLHEDVLWVERRRAELLLEYGLDKQALEALCRVLQLDPICEQSAAAAMKVARRLGDRAKVVAVFNRLQNNLEQLLGVGPETAVQRVYEQTLAEWPSRPSVTPAADGDLFQAVAETVSEAGSEHENVPEPDLQAEAHAAVIQGISGHAPTFNNTFVGRQHDLTELNQLIRKHRLVTLRGGGGVGKTRLAYELAQRIHSNFTAGALWVDLASLRIIGMLPWHMAAMVAVGGKQSPDRLHSICQTLRLRQQLIILDNCEHLIEEVRQLVQVVLASCPDIHILATSQISLDVPGEIPYSVHALVTPDSYAVEAMAHSDSQGFQGTLTDIAHYDAVALFVQRVRSVRPNFRLTPQNAKTVAHICRSLNGVPLSLELAAMRMAYFSPEQIAARIDQKFTVFNVMPEHGTGRHSSLQAMVDWSYELLPDKERELWQCMSVFSGSFSLEAADAVAGYDKKIAGQGTLAESITMLVDRSVLRTQTDDDGMRYYFLDTHREYGLLRLRAAGRLDETRRLHLYWCQSLVGQWWNHISNDGETTWFRQVEAEYNEIRLALQFAVTAGDTTAALQLVTSLWWYWFVRGDTAEGLHMISLVAEQAAGRGDALAGLLLYAAGMMHMRSGRVVAADDNFTESFRLLSADGGAKELWLIHMGLGFVRNTTGHWAEAIGHFDLCVRYAHRAGMEHLAVLPLWHRGNVELQRNCLAEAQKYYNECLALTRRLGNNRGEAICLGALGTVAVKEGHIGLAIMTLEQAIAILQDIGDYHFSSLLYDRLGAILYHHGQLSEAARACRRSLNLKYGMAGQQGVFVALGQLAKVAVAQGDYVKAARLFAAREKWPVADEINPMLPYGEPTDIEQALGQLKQKMNEKARAVAWQEGVVMRPAAAVQYALDDGAQQIT